MYMSSCDWLILFAERLSLTFSSWTFLSEWFSPDPHRQERARSQRLTTSTEAQASVTPLWSLILYCHPDKLWSQCDVKGQLVQKAKISLFLNQMFKHFSLPKMYYHRVQKVDMPVNILLSAPLLQSVQLTNVAPLSCMCIWYYYYYYYLKKNLQRIIAKGRDGLMMHHHNWTEIFYFVFVLDWSHKWEFKKMHL